MLFLVFLFFFSLLVSILGLPLSCLQMVYIEHDQAMSISIHQIRQQLFQRRPNLNFITAVCYLWSYIAQSSGEWLIKTSTDSSFHNTCEKDNEYILAERSLLFPFYTYDWQGELKRLLSSPGPSLKNWYFAGIIYGLSSTDSSLCLDLIGARWAQ
jgi:hypothetical protein